MSSLSLDADGNDDKGKVGPRKNGDSEVWRANGIFVVITHIVAAWTLLFYGRPANLTILLSILMWYAGTIGITMGYHRLWSHRSFSAYMPLRVFLGICGTVAFQGSIKWWVQRHRLHHRFTDSPDDPYDATQGLFYSHIGWIFTKPYYPRIKQVDISDLTSDPVVVFQHKHYIPLAVAIGFILPTVIAMAWNDPLGAYLYGGFVAHVCIWHVTFFINSLAHWLGPQDFSSENSARGGIILALLTAGEGYHNFHHAFPRDFRNGIKWYHYDPTKWAISLCALLGLAYDLRQTPSSDISKALVQAHEIRIIESDSKQPGSNSNYTQMWDQVRIRAQKGMSLVDINHPSPLL